MMAAAAKHVVLFPFPGQGHLSAFVSVAGLLHGALPDAAITLVSTPRNVAALRTTACSNSNSSFLGFHVLPFTPADHGLPPDCESSDAIQPMAIFDLIEAFEALEAAFDDYLSAAVAAAGGSGRDVFVVSDPLTAWTVTASRRRGCAHAFFASCGAYGTAVLHSLCSHLPVRPDPATGRVHLPEYPEVIIHRSQVTKHALGPPAVSDRGARFFGRQIPLGYETDAVLINTVEEFEPNGLAMLRRTLKIPVCPIGPLVRATSLPTSPEAEAAVVSFLDCHSPSSVLYISFGSQNSIRAEHMTELALALESAGRPFIWAVRPPVGHDIKGDFRADQWLPDGFEERARTSNRGLLVRGWAPQVRILAHASTGAFLSHCGWNSVLESVTHGVPIIGWPLSSEQFYNANMLKEEWGVCVEVARGDVEDTVVSRAALFDVVETVMGQTAKAAEMRRQLREIKEVMEVSWKEGSGSSRKAMEDFLRAMNLR
ncbi:UDP-glycosyltransferase 92A1-like [Miscanthus floridulus]|uniref:UDP-glycosyltransferase 92A1-like n=1 Tax=Miscanthus floridulus TaxID=154761 RepID=UPI0034594292